MREMSRHLCFLLLLGVTVLHHGLAVFSEEALGNVHKKFEFKYSFKPPMLVNSHGDVPFWERGGDAIPTEHQIRVCPSIQDRRGWLWAKSAFDKPDWMIDVQFTISGKHTYGADGMAFWYTATKGTGGPVFGNSENFIGLAVIIDTFDNNGVGDSPKIGVYLNNGTLHINQGSDGEGQDSGNCIKFIRNKRYSPKLRIAYNQRKLRVWVHEGDSNDENAYDLCAQIDDVTSIPANGYFGVSAATGGLSDDHDVKSFVVHSLKSMDDHRQEMTAKYDEDKIKSMQTDYQKKSDTFETRKSRYDKDHGKEETDWQKRVEMEESIQLIYDMHSSLNRKLKDINMQLDTIMTMGNNGGAGGGGGGGSSDGTVLAAEGRMTHHIQELRSLFEKGSNNNVPASEQMQPLYAMKENINQLLERMDKLQNKIQSPNSDGSNCSNTCLSTWFFVMVMLTHFVIVIGFLYYKHSQERNAKKFF